MIQFRLLIYYFPSSSLFFFTYFLILFPVWTDSGALSALTRDGMNKYVSLYACMASTYVNTNLFVMFANRGMHVLTRMCVPLVYCDWHSQSVHKAIIIHTFRPDSNYGFAWLRSFVGSIHRRDICNTKSVCGYRILISRWTLLQYRAERSHLYPETLCIKNTFWAIVAICWSGLLLCMWGGYRFESRLLRRVSLQTKY